MKYFLSLIFCSLLLASCEIEITGNGKLEGNWQLREIDTLATNKTCNMSKSNIYWGIEGDIVQVRSIDKNQKFLFHLEQKENSMTISKPYYVQTKDYLTAVESDTLLTSIGINGLQVSYHISHKGNTLILTDHLLRLHFRKY